MKVLFICSCMLLTYGLDACVNVGPGDKYTVDEYGSFE